MIKYDYNILIHTLKEVKMKKKISISIDERVLTEIQKIAKCENRTVSNYIEKTINTALAQYLKNAITSWEVEK